MPAFWATQSFWADNRLAQYSTILLKFLRAKSISDGTLSIMWWTLIYHALLSGTLFPSLHCFILFLFDSTPASSGVIGCCLEFGNA